MFQSPSLSLSSPPPTRSSLPRLPPPVYRLLLAPSEKQRARQWQRYVFAPFSSPPSFVFSPSNSLLLFRFPRKGKGWIEEERSRDTHRLDSSPVTEISFNPHSTRYFPVTNIRGGIDSICTSVARAGSRNGVRERTVLNVRRGRGDVETRAALKQRWD